MTRRRGHAVLESVDFVFCQMPHCHCLITIIGAFYMPIVPRRACCVRLLPVRQYWLSFNLSHVDDRSVASGTYSSRAAQFLDREVTGRRSGDRRALADAGLARSGGDAR